jgi:hypothetical protein
VEQFAQPGGFLQAPGNNLVELTIRAQDIALNLDGLPKRSQGLADSIQQKYARRFWRRE